MYPIFHQYRSTCTPWIGAKLNLFKFREFQYFAKFKLNLYVYCCFTHIISANGYYLDKIYSNGFKGKYPVLPTSGH